MARDVIDIIIRERGARRTGKKLAGIGASARSSAGGVQLLRRALRGLGAGLAIRQVLRSIDSYQRMENQLRVVGYEQHQLNYAMQQLFEIAQKTRTPIEATTNLYGKLAQASGELGKTQLEMLRFTELVGKSLAIQGTSTSGSRAALLQLSQAMGEGIVRAQEYNSLIENARPLLVAAANGMDRAGGSVAKLRTLVLDGAITSRQFFDAIIAGGGILDDQFGQTVPTIGQALTVLNNSWTKFIGESKTGQVILASVSGVLIALAGGITLFGSATETAATFVIDNLNLIYTALVALTASQIPLLLRLLGPLVAAFSATGAAAGVAAAGTALFSTALGVLGGPLGIVLALLAGAASYFFVFRDTSTAAEVATKGFNGKLADNANKMLVAATATKAYREELVALIKVQGAAASAEAERIGGILDTQNAALAAVDSFIGPQRAFVQRNVAIISAERDKVLGEYKAAVKVSNAFVTQAAAAEKIAGASGAAVSVNPAGVGGGGGSGGASKVAELIGVQKRLKEILDQTAEANAKAAVEQQALTLAYEQGGITAERYAVGMDKARLFAVEAALANTNLEKSIRDTNTAILELKVETGNGSFADGFLLGLSRMTAGAVNFAANTGAVFSNFFEGFAGGFADSVGKAIVYSDDLGASLSKVANDALASLISGLVKMGVQWLINAVIGKSVAAAATAATAAQASATALAWAPAAALASLATSGSNAAPAAAGIAATIATTQAFAAVAAFANGGPVSGPGGPRADKIPALLSDGEFVVNARDTQRHRTLLELINSGQNVTRHFANGGRVSNATPRRAPALRRVAPSAAAKGDTHITNVNVAVEGGSSGNAEQDQEYAERIAETMVDSINAIVDERLSAASQYGGAANPRGIGT